MRLASIAVVIMLAPSLAFGAELTAQEIVAKSIVNYEKDWKAALEFTYMERDVTKDATGETKSTDLSQVSVLDGTPYSRVIAKNGRPLRGDEARKEEEKFGKAAGARGGETPNQRERRIAKYENERHFLFEIPDAFDMKLLGKESIDGRPNFVIALTPKEGYVPKEKNARMFKDIEGKLWVDEADLRWTKATATVIDPISIGWFLARVAAGSHIVMTQVKVDNEHWMPKSIDVEGSARVLLVSNRKIDETMSCSGYKFVGKRVPAVTAKNP